MHIIVCLSETLTTISYNNDIDVVNYVKYHVPSVSKNRGRKSGGIVVYVKSMFATGITCIESKTNLIWMNLAFSYFGWDDAIHLAAIYCPPHNSTYHNNQLGILMEDITNYSRNGINNARVGEMPDHIIDDEMDDFVPVGDEYVVDRVPRKRHNCDNIINEFGKHLIEINVSCQLRNFNGRFLGDSMGRFTFYSKNGASTIDYGICDHSVMKYVNHFRVFPL